MKPIVHSLWNASRKPILLFALLSSIAFSQERKRVAVMNFEYGTVSASVTQLFGSNEDIGKGIADMLVNDGRYSVIERKMLDKLIAEQNFSNSDRADPSSAARIGKLLGVDAIIIGSITQFGRDDKSTDVGAGGFGAMGRFGLGGVRSKEAKAVVQITARMVNVETGEILASVAGRGESKRAGTSLLGAGGGSGGGGGAGVSMQSSNFGATIIGEATSAAVTQCAGGLDEKAASLPNRVIQVDALVADVDGEHLILNVGSTCGVKVGDTLTISHLGREIKDPSTGKVLRHSESEIGTVRITQVDASSSEGTYSGQAGVVVGDRVKR
jgi:curli biogenesis system outer membrane secretion channel CsgG